MILIRFLFLFTAYGPLPTAYSAPPTPLRLPLTPNDEPMIEYIATPGWKSEPVTIKDWAAWLESSGIKVEIVRESSSSSWLEMPSLRLRGLADFAGKHVESVNFELHARDPAPALALIQAAVAHFGWELHSDEDLADLDDDSDADSDDDDDENEERSLRG